MSISTQINTTYGDMLMSVKVDWDTNVKDVILYQFQGRWTWREFLVGFEQELRMAQSLDGRPYYVIGDTTEGARLPGGAIISHVYSIFKRYPDNWRGTIIVSQNGFLRALYNIGARIHPDAASGFKIIESIEDAYEDIRRNRQIHRQLT